MEKKHGIVYCLTDGTKKYIGSTFNLKGRKALHRKTDYLQIILKNENHRYDIMAEGDYTKRELLDQEDEFILSNECINKRKPLRDFKNKQHKAMLKWGKKHKLCEACKKHVTRWNWCKHVKSITHIANIKKHGEIIEGGRMTYMKAVAIYNEQQREKDANHKHILPSKGSIEQQEVIEILNKD